MTAITDILEEYGSSIIRSQLQKIVEIYDLEWIIAHELTQNALDAVQSNPNTTRGVVSVEFAIDTDTVTVVDNGFGFRRNHSLLVPGGSGVEKRLKSRSPSKGYQGVGLKAVMYSTENFAIESVSDNHQWLFSVEGLSRYLDSAQNYVPEFTESNIVLDEERLSYTKVTAQFPSGSLLKFFNGLNRFLLEDSVKWQQLYLVEASKSREIASQHYVSHLIRWYFQTQSYVGCVNRLLNIQAENPGTGSLEEVKPTEITITLTSSSNFTGVSGKLGSWLQQINADRLQISVDNRYWDYTLVAQENAKQSVKYRIAPDIITMKPNNLYWDVFTPTFRDKFLDLKLVPDESKTSFREKYADFIALLERPRSSVRAEDYQDVIEKITGIYFCIGRTSHHEQLGLYNRGQRLIASNGTPTAHELNVRSTSSTWYAETITFIVNVDATLNLGKRHLASTRLVSRVNSFFEACYPKLVAISKHFVERPSSSQDIELPNVLSLGKIDRQNINFRRFPVDEGTLIGLFSAVVSRIEPSLSIYGYFGKAVYDGKFQWDTRKVSSEKDLLTMEFKVELNNLVQEFNLATNDKEFEEVDLIVVWDRRLDIPGWSVKGISQSRELELGRRNVPTRLISYILEDSKGNYRPLICAADLLARIPVVDFGDDDLDDYLHVLG